MSRSLKARIREVGTDAARKELIASTARLAILYSRRGHSDEALRWLGRAQAAAEVSGDKETVEYVGAVGEKLG